MANKRAHTFSNDYCKNCKAAPCIKAKHPRRVIPRKQSQK